MASGSFATRIAGIVVALTFATQAVVLPAVHPCTADHTAGHAHGAATRTPMHGAAHAQGHGGEGAHAGPGERPRHATGASRHANPDAGTCTCVGCACCSLRPRAGTALESPVASHVAFRDPRAASAPRGGRHPEPDRVLPPSTGPPAHHLDLT